MTVEPFFIEDGSETKEIRGSCLIGVDREANPVPELVRLDCDRLAGGAGERERHR